MAITNDGAYDVGRAGPAGDSLIPRVGNCTGPYSRCLDDKGNLYDALNGDRAEGYTAEWARRNIMNLTRQRHRGLIMSDDTASNFAAIDHRGQEWDQSSGSVPSSLLGPLENNVKRVFKNTISTNRSKPKDDRKLPDKLKIKEPPPKQPEVSVERAQPARSQTGQLHRLAVKIQQCYAELIKHEEGIKSRESGLARTEENLRKREAEIHVREERTKQAEEDLRIREEQVRQKEEGVVRQLEEIEQLEMRTKQHEEAVNQRDKEARALVKQAAIQRKEIKAKEEKLRFMEKKLVGFEKEVKDRDVQVRHREERIREQEEELLHLEDKVSLFESQLKARESKLKQLHKSEKIY